MPTRPDQGNYELQTHWHRAVSFGWLAPFPLPLGIASPGNSRSWQRSSKSGNSCRACLAAKHELSLEVQRRIMGRVAVLKGQCIVARPFGGSAFVGYCSLM